MWFFARARCVYVILNDEIAVYKEKKVLGSTCENILTHNIFWIIFPLQAITCLNVIQIMSDKIINGYKKSLEFKIILQTSTNKEASNWFRLTKGTCYIKIAPPIIEPVYWGHSKNHLDAIRNLPWTSWRCCICFSRFSPRNCSLQLHRWSEKNRLRTEKNKKRLVRLFHFNTFKQKIIYPTSLFFSV